MWGTFLSEPLPIVGLVGRYPANCLMGREPIRGRRSFQTNPMRGLLLRGLRRRFHRLSPCHGHVAHALRTLPPVAARSIATPALPLDLHVLSLPLAFILSQDQTLLCIYTYYSSLTPTLLQFLFRIDALVSCTFSVLACTFLPDFSMNFVKNPARCPNGNAKVELYFDSTKLFSKKRQKNWPQNEGQNLYLF